MQLNQSNISKIFANVSGIYTEVIRTGCYSGQALRLVRMLKYVVKDPLFPFEIEFGRDGEILLRYSLSKYGNDDIEAVRRSLNGKNVKNKLMHRGLDLYPELEILLDKIELPLGEFLEKYGKRGEEFVGHPLGPFEIAQVDAYEKMMNDAQKKGDMVAVIDANCVLTHVSKDFMVSEICKRKIDKIYKENQDEKVH